MHEVYPTFLRLHLVHPMLQQVGRSDKDPTFVLLLVFVEVVAAAFVVYPPSIRHHQILHPLVDYLALPWLSVAAAAVVVVDLCEEVAEAVVLAAASAAVVDSVVAVVVLSAEAKDPSFPHFQIDFQVQARLQLLEVLSVSLDKRRPTLIPSARRAATSFSMQESPCSLHKRPPSYQRDSTTLE